MHKTRWHYLIKNINYQLLKIHIFNCYTDCLILRNLINLKEHINVEVN